MPVKQRKTASGVKSTRQSKIKPKATSVQKTYGPDYFTGELDREYCAAFGWIEGRDTPPFFPLRGMHDSQKHFNHVVMHFRAVYVNWPQERVKAGAVNLIKNGNAIEVLQALQRQLLLIDWLGYHGKHFGVITACGIPFPRHSDPSDDEIAIGIFNHISANDWMRWLMPTLLQRAANVATWICAVPGLPTVAGVDYGLLARACNDFAFDLTDPKAEQRIASDSAVLGANFDEMVQPKVNQSVNLAEQGIWQTYVDIAENYGVSQDALRKRLSIWRESNLEGWQEVSDAKPREPKHLYLLSAILPIVNDMKSSSERPAK